MTRREPHAVDEINPYAAPQADILPPPLGDPASEGRGAWADGQLLVMAKQAILPSRCFQCNEPTALRINRTFTWHPVGWYLLLLLSLWPYIIAYLIVRKTARVALPICERHRAARRRRTLICWLVVLAGFGLLFAPAINPDLGPLVVVGLVAIVVATIYGLLKSNPLSPVRIDATHAWFKKAGPAFLRSLPPLPAPVVEI